MSTVKAEHPREHGSLTAPMPQVHTHQSSRDEHIPLCSLSTVAPAIFVVNDTPGAIFPYIVGHLGHQGVMVGMG